MPPNSLCVRTGIPRIPSESHPDLSAPFLHFHRVSQTLSAVPPQPRSLPGLPFLAPTRPWQAGGWSRDAGPVADRDFAGQALRAGTPGCWLLEPRPPGQARCPLPGSQPRPNRLLFRSPRPWLGCTGCGAVHSDRCGPRGGRGKVAAAGQWALQGRGFLEDSGCVILEPPGTTSFSWSCTCCWRPMICRGLVLLGLSQLWLEKKNNQKTKQSHVAPSSLFRLVSLWANVESCFK